MKASAYSRPLIPKPVSVAWVPGAFHLTPRVGISWSTDHAADAPELGRIADMLAERMRVATGFPFPCAASATSAPATIHLSIKIAGAAAAATGATGPQFAAEAYRLTVTEAGVRLSAGTTEGIFRGIQTLCQLPPPEIDAPEPVAEVEWTLPCCDIADAPVYAWRGMMLDVARHFHSVATVKRLIDQLARLKFNKLHLHLTDDQGWRLEIKSWPALTEICGPVAVNGDPGGF